MPNPARPPLALPWFLAPLALLVPIVVAGQRGFAGTAGLANAILLGAWCAFFPLSLIRLHQLRQYRPVAAGLFHLQFLINAVALLVCDKAPGIHSQLALAVAVAFAGTGLRAALAAFRTMKELQAPPRARMGLYVGLILGAVAALAITLASRKAGVGLAHHGVIAAGQRELLIYNQLCVPVDDRPCTPHGAFVYVRTRGLPVVLFKKILPDATFTHGNVEERAGRIFIDFGEGGPRFSLDEKTYGWRAE
jgi:hypothetical protein